MSDTLEELVARAGTRPSRPLDVEDVIARGRRRRRRRTALSGAGAACLLLVVAAVGWTVPGSTPAPYVGSPHQGQAVEITSYVLTGEAVVVDRDGEYISARFHEPLPSGWPGIERDGYWWTNYDLNGVRWRHGETTGDGPPSCLPSATGAGSDAELLPVRLQVAEVGHPDGDGTYPLLWLECLH
jgi:hypothetical protein